MNPVARQGRIPCEKYNYNEQTFSVWNDRVKTFLPGSDGAYDVGGWCTLADGSQIVSLVTKENPEGYDFSPPGSVSVGFLVTLLPDGKLIKALPGFSAFGGDVSACTPDFIEGNLLYMQCNGGDGGWSFSRSFVVNLDSGEDSTLTTNETMFQIGGCYDNDFDCDIKSFKSGKYAQNVTKSPDGFKKYSLSMGECSQPNPNNDEEEEWETRTRKALSNAEVVNVTLGCTLKDFYLSVYTKKVSESSKQAGIALFTSRGLLQDMKLFRDTIEYGAVPMTTPQVQSGSLFLYAELYPDAPTASQRLVYVDVANKKIETLVSEDVYRNRELCDTIGLSCD